MLKELFAKSKKKYATVPLDREKQDVPEGIMTKCPGCKKIMYTKELVKNNKVCLHCGFHHSMSSHERIECLFDAGSFNEFDKEMISVNPLGFRITWINWKRTKRRPRLMRPLLQE